MNDDFKSLKKYFNKNVSRNDSNAIDSFFVKKFISKILICLILFILFMILNKKSPNFKNSFYEKVYNDTFLFATFNNWYSENFGNIFPLNHFFETSELVFDEELAYDSVSLFKDGVSLSVSSNYLVPVLESGIVIYLGEKKEYGNTLIIQQENGINVWYSNLNFFGVSMYEYVNKGDFLGEVKDNVLYLVFEKDGEFLNYKEYI